MSKLQPDRLGQMVLGRVTNTVAGQRGRAMCRVALEMRRALVAVRDPIVQYDVLGHELRLCLSHDLPLYRGEFPGYSDNLRRVAAAVHAKHPGTVAIDVGANIGDSIAFLRAAGYERIIVVEPAEEFVTLLRENTRGMDGVVVEEVALAATTGELDGAIVTRKGTGRVVHGGKTIHTTTVDAVVDSHADLGRVSLIKTDTDGLDLDIIRGAERTLASNPAVFFEHDPKRFGLDPATCTAFFSWLAAHGYGPTLVYDRFGTLVAATDLTEKHRVEELDHYARTTDTPYYYFDVVVFGRDDVDVADAIRRDELGRGRDGDRT